MKRSDGRIYMDLQEYDPTYYGGVMSKFFPWAPKIWGSWISRSASINGKEPKILDIGCGPGQVTLSLATSCMKLQMNPKIIGVDMLESAITLANKRKENLPLDIEFQLGSAVALPFRDNEFDLVMASMLFPFLKEEELIAFFNETYRVLNPHGRFHFVHPVRCRFNWLVAVLVEKNPFIPKNTKDYEVNFVEHSYTPQEIINLMNKSQLTMSQKRFNFKWLGLLGEVYGSVKK